MVNTGKQWLIIGGGQQHFGGKLQNHFRAGKLLDHNGLLFLYHALDFWVDIHNVSKIHQIIIQSAEQMWKKLGYINNTIAYKLVGSLAPRGSLPAQSTLKFSFTSRAKPLAILQSHKQFQNGALLDGLPLRVQSFTPALVSPTAFLDASTSLSCK